MGMKQKKKIQNGRLKKRSFSRIVNSQYFFVKISWIGRWISRMIDAKGIDVAQPIWL
jgi:hypothetical protein